MNQTKIHISERFFTKAKRYFGSLQSALSEALQNAYRATLPRLRGGELCVIQVRYASQMRNLVIRDFGLGIEDIGAALSIGISNWGKGVEEEQDPAGMGLCGVMAYCDRLCFRSRFGSLDIDTKQFFESKEYRDALLDKIDTGEFLNGDGTEITMVNVHLEGGDGVRTALNEAARYHTAIRIEYTEDQKPVERVQNFLEVGAWKECPETYRGYKVYSRDASSSNCYANCYRDTLNLVWHGHLIKVPLKDVMIPVRLPEFPEPVMVDLEIPGLEPRTVVIDYGVAPVTPKLPDRNAVIMDDKTKEFISGLFMPEITARIEKVRRALIDAATVLATGTFKDRQKAIYDVAPGAGHRYHSTDYKRTCRQLQGPLYAALFKHYVNHAMAETLVPEDLDQGRDEAKYIKDLVPFDALPVVYSGKILLWSDRSNCGRLVGCDNEHPDQFIIKEHSSSSEAAWDPDAHETELVNGFEVIPGLVHEITEAVGEWPKELGDLKFTRGLLVVHLDKTAKDLSWNTKDLCRKAVVVKTEGPIKLGLVTYPEDGTLQDCLEGITDVSEVTKADEDIGEGITLKEVLKGEKVYEVPGVMFRTQDDMESYGSVFVGPEKEIMSLIGMVCSYESYGPSRSDEMSSEEWSRYVQDHWDDFRSKITGVPELDTEIDALIEKIRNRVQLGDRSAPRIMSFGVNLDKNTLTFRTTEGKTTKTKYR